MTKSRVLFIKESFSGICSVACDVADTYQKQVIGLQNHASLSPMNGMLFTYASESPLSFWMGSVKFGIDIVFANKDNEIVKIYHNCQPNSREIYSCNSASKVIEVVGNYCIANNIKEGDKVFSWEFSKSEFLGTIINEIKETKLRQQKELGMSDWMIKIIIPKHARAEFIYVDWTDEDYDMKKADILINPKPELIEEYFLKTKFSLKEAIRHALLHIKIGHKNKLSNEKEQVLINKYVKQQPQNTKNIVFDMDATLLHTFTNKHGKSFNKAEADCVFIVNGETYYCKLRPGIKEFLLFLQNKKYTLHCFSAGTKDYVIAALKNAGLYEYFNKILTKEDLTYKNGNDIKNIGKIEPNLNSITVIDNSDRHYPGNLAERHIDIESYYGDHVYTNYSELFSQIQDKLAGNKRIQVEGQNE